MGIIEAYSPSTLKKNLDSDKWTLAVKMTPIGVVFSLLNLPESDFKSMWKLAWGAGLVVIGMLPGGQPIALALGLGFTAAAVTVTAIEGNDAGGVAKGVGGMVSAGKSLKVK